MKVIHEIAGYTAMGEPVFYFKVVNASGAWVGFTNWGARWIEAGVPDSEGRLTDVITGYDNPMEYLSDTYYMGATVGRFANRIANASFLIDGLTYRLETNDRRQIMEAIPVFISDCGNGKSWLTASVLCWLHRMAMEDIPVIWR